MPRLNVQIIEDFVGSPVKAEDVLLEHNARGSTNYVGVAEEMDRLSPDSMDSVTFMRCYLRFRPQFDGQCALVKHAGREGDRYRILSTSAGYRLFGAYREFLKGDVTGESRRHAHERLNFLGVGGALLLDGGQAVYSVRRHDVEFAGMMNVPGCGMVQYDDAAGAMPSPIEVFYRKEQDKLGLVRDDFEKVYPLAFTKSFEHTYNPHLTFAGELKMDIKTLQERLDEVVKANRGEDIGVGSFDIDKAGDFLENNWYLMLDLLPPSVMYLVKSVKGEKAFSELEGRLSEKISLQKTESFSKEAFMKRKLSGI